MLRVKNETEYQQMNKCAYIKIKKNKSKITMKQL
jgi:hypothetical protein